MNPLADKLVALFTQHLETGPELVPEYQQLRGNGEPGPAFLEWRSLLDGRRVQALNWRALSLQDQVKRALMSVRMAPTEEKREVVMQFMREALGPKWSAAQQAYYDRLAPVFVLGYDYFLSFTGRSASAHQAVLRVNRDFDGFIGETLVAQVKAGVDLGAHNLLAHALKIRLDERRERGFFYPDLAGNSQPVIDKLQRACVAAPCFVQLVDNEMWRERESPADTNYCLVEYHWAEGAGTRLLFVLPYANRAELMSAEEVAPDCGPWHDFVTSTVDAPLLEPARVGDAPAIHRLGQRVLDLALHIATARAERLAAIPM